MLINLCDVDSWLPAVSNMAKERLEIVAAEKVSQQ